MSTRNPAKSRPLSRNVKRLMKMARESPLNPDVEKIERAFTERDLAYCDMQGSIFITPADDKASYQPAVNAESNTVLRSTGWNASFGIPTREYAAFTQVQRIDGYDFAGKGLIENIHPTTAETDVGLTELNRRME